MRFSLVLSVAAWTAIAPAAGLAGAGKIEHATLIRTRVGWDIRMLLSHAGEGEPFGINAWSVTTDRGERLKAVNPWRPHPTGETWESWMTGVWIPPDAKTVSLRLHDKVHGFEGVAPLVVDLSKKKGDKWEIVDESKPEKYRRYWGEHAKRLMKLSGDYVPYPW